MISFDSNNIDAIGIIPARYASMRLPGKPLLEINGMPMIYHVWLSACSSNILRRVVIATDDERIAEAAMDFGAEYVLSPSDLPSGTDRIIYSLKELGEVADFVVNIQGDEPLITANLIDDLILHTAMNKSDVGTVVKKITAKEDLFNNSVVKVVIDDKCNALYFSRSPVPFQRDIPEDKWLDNTTYYKHIGIYNYTFKSLLEFSELSPSKLELNEKLEQLRLMERGAKYFCLETDNYLIGIDTPEDLNEIRAYFEKK